MLPLSIPNALPARAAMVIIARELAVSGLRISAGAQGVAIPASQLRRAKTTLRVAAVLAAALILALPAATHASDAASYGLVASNANFVPGATVEERTAAYRRLYDAGVRAIRLDMSWTSIEPPGAPLHDYDFAERDREVRAITDAGLEVIGLLGYGHPDYSTLGSLAARTPLAGGRLLCATHDELKAADPDTPVLFGGVFFPAVAGLPGMSGPEFVRAAYAADPQLGRCFDALAYHPYPYPFTAPELDNARPRVGARRGGRDAQGHAPG